jgi:type VI secretion system secreted protein VgrG
MEIVTPLGEDVLLFHGMSAREEMSRPFEYHLDLLSSKHDINLDDILGKNVTIKLGLPDDKTRYFNGYVTRFAQSGMYGRYHRYSATVRPWLWFLTRTADCRIFQDMKVPDIIKAVFADHPSADFKLELTSTYRKWTYCVQYRETDFNFVSRLMEQEGIGYYFRHTDGHDTAVLTDSTSKHIPTPGYERLSFIGATEQVKPDLEHVHAWDFEREIQPGVYVHDDYDLERPSVELKTKKVLPRKYTPSDYEIYDYPGEYVQQADGEQYAAVRIDELGSQFETAHAATNARGLSVGSLLTLQDHPRGDQNREHLVIGASYDLTFENYEGLPEAGGTAYRCAFVTMPSAQQFRPKRLTPKPFMQGPQTAVVVGPPGEEIYKDDYGRVKVQFHWDRYGKKDQNSSCWIRVSQMWAGKGWGSVSTPRIGHEVIVDFLEGDPDQPIIIGSVHNAENKPPHTGVVSGLKSNTHKGKGYNAMTMDDTAGKENITIHAQYNMGTTVEHDETHTVVTGTFTETIKGNTTIHVTTGDLEQKVMTGKADYSVAKTQCTTVKLQIKEESTTADILNVAKDKIRLDSNGKSSGEWRPNGEIEINGADQIALISGDSSITLKKDGTILISGKKVTISGTDETAMGVGNQNVKCDKAQVGTSGAAISSSATGKHEITGAVVKIN